MILAAWSGLYWLKAEIDHDVARTTAPEKKLTLPMGWTPPHPQIGI